MKCAVGNCKQSNSKKTSVSFYSFPRDESQRKLWVIFCKRVQPVNVKKEKICALHFKQEDFERNLMYEMGCSKRSVKKLKSHAVPSIENTVIDSEKKIAYETEKDETNEQIINQSLDVKCVKTEFLTDDEEDSLQNYTKTLELKTNYLNPFYTVIDSEKKIAYETEKDETNKQIINQKSLDVKCVTAELLTDIEEDSLQNYTKTLELKIDSLLKENCSLKMAKSQCDVTIANLSCRIQKLSLENSNLKKALRRLCTEGQIKKTKKIK